MPYIKDYQREQLDEKIKIIAMQIQLMSKKDPTLKAGILNYAITNILSKSFRLGTEPKYDKINSAIGVTECVKLELYRRLAGPYEDLAIEKNGDIEEYKTPEEYPTL